MPLCKRTLPALILSAKSVEATFGGQMCFFLSFDWRHLSEVAFLQHLAVMAQIEIAWAETRFKAGKGL